MIEKDTIRLLRECDAGIRMGISSIEDVIDDVKNQKFKDKLNACKDEHENLQNKLLTMLDKYHDEGKDPNPMAKGMSWIKTKVMLAADDSDNTIADLMTDGCNMGIKSLSKYLNKYKAADEDSKNITKDLVDVEEKLCKDIREYL